MLDPSDEAERRNKIRGQIAQSNGTSGGHERTEFCRAHVVACYIAREGIVVARGLIDVPISAKPVMAASSVGT